LINILRINILRKNCAQIWLYLKDCKDHFKLDSVLQIRKQRALEEVEEPEPDPKEGTMKVLKSTVRFGQTAAGTKVFIRTVIRKSSEQQQSEKEL
jgi:hypothetical protein